LSELNFDISKIWFIPAMNDDSKLDPALRDRLHIVNLRPYEKSEMVQIIRLHTLPEILKDKGIGEDDIKITDGASQNLLRQLGKEVQLQGLRPVEGVIRNIVSKLNLLRSFNGMECQIPLTYSVPDFKGFPYTITETNLHYLFKERSSSIPTLSYYS